MKNIKSIGAIIMVIMLFMKAMVAPILFLDYELRKDYIIQNFCINKDKPKLHCDGKCYLAKRIAAADKQEESQNTSTSLSKIINLEINPIQVVFDFEFDYTFNYKKINNNFVYLHSIYSSTLGSVFQPPRV